MESPHEHNIDSFKSIDLTWSNLSCMGLLNADESLETAINLFQRALSKAEKEFGEHSAQAGMCLVELHDLYLNEKNHEAAEQTEEKIRALLPTYARRLGVEPDAEKICNNC